MTRFIIIILITLFSSLKIIPQTKYLDSINHSKIDFYKNINSDSLFFYCDKLENSNDICKKIVASTGRAYGFYRLKKYDKAERISINVIKQVDSLLKVENLTCLIDRKIAALNRLFWLKKNQEKYEEAYSILIKYEHEILNHPIQDQKWIRNKLGLALSKAVIKNKLNMQEKSKAILLNTISESKNPILKSVQKNSFFLQWKANSFNCLGNTYMSINSKKPNKTYLDSADYYFNKAYKITQQFIPEHKDSEIFYNLRKTEVLMARKEFSKAIDLINNYKNISNGYPYFHREYFQKAICFHNLKKSDSAIYYSNKLLKNHKKCETSKLITIYDILSKEYNNLNKLDSAYKYSKLTLDQYNLAKNTKDKTFNLFYNNNFEQAQKLNKTIEKREAKKQRNLIISFIVLLLTFIIITFYLLNKEKEKKKELILIMNKNKPIETERKEYNIDEALETKILDEFKNVTESLDFLKPEFSINYIAEKLDTNTTYISFVFNKHHDESFKQYCTKLKINYVVEKLKTDKNFRKYSIQAIAEEIGYTNASAFTRAFKKHISITPSAFLKSIEN
ncbi:helix-turn-helix domain-containing protein [Tenacibaculum ascidiaceicola]|uniref:helix-turn-helix domain-containing protein n=1 Tax=Tenacibaculum ascidiaceicola TaxID=1699411 RepID=UPI003895A960